MSTLKAGTATTNITRTATTPVMTAAASHELMNTDIIGGTCRTRFRIPCSRAVVRSKMTLVKVAVVIEKTAIDGVKNCENATSPPVMLTFELLKALNMTKDPAGTRA